MGAALVGIMCAIRSRFCSSSLGGGVCPGWPAGRERHGGDGTSFCARATAGGATWQRRVSWRPRCASERDCCGCANCWSAQGTADNQSCEAPRGPARGLLDDWVLDSVWQERVGVEEDGQTFAIRVGVELGGDGRGRVSLRRAPPAFHCKSDSRYCTWRRSLTGFDMERLNSGFGFSSW